MLGRMFNVFGETIDKQGPVEGDQRRSIHREPVPLSQRVTPSEIFETGIKAIDLLAPLERGGKAGLLAVTEGVFDRLPLGKIGQVEKGVREAIWEQLPDVYQRIQAGEALGEDDQDALLRVARRTIGSTYERGKERDAHA